MCTNNQSLLNIQTATTTTSDPPRPISCASARSLICRTLTDPPPVNESLRQFPRPPTDPLCALCKEEPQTLAAEMPQAPLKVLTHDKKGYWRSQGPPSGRPLALKSQQKLLLLLVQLLFLLKFSFKVDPVVYCRFKPRPGHTDEIPKTSKQLFTSACVFRALQQPPTSPVRKFGRL